MWGRPRDRSFAGMSNPLAPHLAAQRDAELHRRRPVAPADPRPRPATALSQRALVLASLVARRDPAPRDA